MDSHPETHPASRLAVIMSVDVVDYARTMSEDETAAIAAIGELKDRHLEPRVFTHGGEVLKRMGDGWILAFSSVGAAVRCAMEVQNALVDHRSVKLRIGAHIGEIVFDETDFHGAGVNLAARLQTEAPPGGVMISQDLHRQLTGSLAQAFHDAGSFKLKNIALPVTGFQWRPERRGTKTADEVPAIAVEAFPAVPEDSETQAAAADLRDQIIVRLSRRTGVQVLDRNATPAEESDYLLRGRLRLTGGRGRFTLSLILRAEGRPLWTQTYEGATADIFGFCDDVIERADADLRLQINAFDAERIAHLPDEELSVSELRSRAANNFYKVSIETWEAARALLERALRLSPGDAMTLAMRGEAVVTLAAARHEKLLDADLERLEADLNRAVETAPRSDYVFWARGLFRVYAQTDAAGARKDAERTLALSPAYAPGYELRGLACLLTGEYEAAKENFAKAVSLSEFDPLLPYRLYLSAVASLCADRPTEAAKSIEQAIQLRPNLRAFRKLQALCLRRSGDAEGAEKAEARAAKLPDAPSILAPRPPLADAKSEILQALAPSR